MGRGGTGGGPSWSTFWDPFSVKHYFLLSGEAFLLSSEGGGICLLFNLPWRVGEFGWVVFVVFGLVFE